MLPVETIVRRVKKKRGRPRKKKKSGQKLGRKRHLRDFDETKVGHYLKYEAPIEYDLLFSSYRVGDKPPVNLIEAISYSSRNPLFKKNKFREALIEYRKHGLYCGNTMPSTIKHELFYRARRGGMPGNTKAIFGMWDKS